MQDFKKFSITEDDIVKIAERKKGEGRRLVMIHGYVDKQGQNIISYQYEVDNCIESYEVIGGNEFPSISSIYDLSAAWPEKELEELMGVKFKGLGLEGRLFMPDTMVEGQGHILVTPLSELRQKVLGTKEE